MTATASLPVRNLVAELGAAGPEGLTAPDLAHKLAYPLWRVYTFILEARAAGYLIQAVPNPGDLTTFRAGPLDKAANSGGQ